MDKFDKRVDMNQSSLLNIEVQLKRNATAKNRKSNTSNNFTYFFQFALTGQEEGIDNYPFEMVRSLTEDDSCTR